MLQKQKIVYCMTIFFAVLILFTGCGRSDTAARTETAFALDTVVRITVYSEKDVPAAQRALARCQDYEAVFSRTRPDSELSALNAARGGTVSAELRAVLECALDISARSGGALDITLGGVSTLYDFTAETPAPPAAEDVAAAMAHSGMDGVELAGSTLTLRDEHTVLDLGAVAKGYIADRLADGLRADGVEHAIINLGGNVLCIGSRPDGSPFRVGVQVPEPGSTENAAELSVRDGSVVTSGNYQRFFDYDGVRWHHILDPETGFPVQNGLASVTVTGPESLRCDALSTACFVLGAEEGLALIETMEGYEALFLCSDGSAYRSTGFGAME